LVVFEVQLVFVLEHPEQGNHQATAANGSTGISPPRLLPGHPRCGRRLTGTIQLQRSGYGSVWVSWCPSLVNACRLQLGSRGRVPLGSLLLQ